MNVQEMYSSFYDYSLQTAFVLCRNIELSKDLAHNFWVKMISSGTNVVHPKGFIFISIKREYLNYNRKKKEVLGLVSSESMKYYSPFKDIEANDLFDKAIDALEMLPEKQKEACYMRLVEQKSFKEIAKELNQSYDTCKANYRHGVLKIRKALQEF